LQPTSDSAEDRLSANATPPQEKGGEEEFGPYEPVENWPQPLVDHEGWTWGSTAGVYAETPDRIWIVQRGELPLPADAAPFTPYGMLNPPRVAARGTPRWEHSIIVVDGNGALVQTWPQFDYIFAQEGGRGPHQIKMSPYDPEKHVWVVDDNLHQIFKFTYDGELVLTLGETGVPGDDETHFGRPSDIAWLPDGTFFVSDGYINNRVVKFDTEGHYLMEWGSEPADPNNPGPSEFADVHGVATDDQRRVYVADRSNSRILVFDENGEYLDEWPNIRSPDALFMTADQHLWVADGETDKILKYDLNGTFLYGWGTAGSYPGALAGAHQISVDQDGNLYLAEIYNGRAQKFRPKSGADPTKLVGREIGRL
jgi:sugar lactone lactonase YvrE